MCGSKWDPGDNKFSTKVGSAGAKYGCCPSGKFMSNGEADPFLEANSCSSCPVGRVSRSENDDTVCSCSAGKYGSAVENDQSSCQNCASGMCSAPGSTSCSMCDKLPNGKRFYSFFSFFSCIFTNTFLLLIF